MRIHGAEPKKTPDIVIYKLPQAETATEAGIGGGQSEAKRTLYAVMSEVRRAILDRYNSLPGSRASRELWIRYQQLESAALSQAAANGLWSQALANFRQGASMLLAAVPKNVDSEPVGVGHYGEGGCSCGCGGKCGCRGVADEDKNVNADFAGILRRALKSKIEGDQKDAELMLQRAKDLLYRLGPSDVAQAQKVFAAVKTAVLTSDRDKVMILRRSQQDTPARQVAGDRFRGISGLQEFTTALEGAKDAARRGQVDNARGIRDNAIRTYFNGAAAEDAGAANAALGQANSVIESYAPAAQMLKAANEQATGAIQTYNQQNEAAYAAEREAEGRRLALAAKHPWLYSIQVDKVPGALAVVDLVDRIPEIKIPGLPSLGSFGTLAVVGAAGFVTYKVATRR